MTAICDILWWYSAKTSANLQDFLQTIWLQSQYKPEQVKSCFWLYYVILYNISRYSMIFHHYSHKHILTSPSSPRCTSITVDLRGAKISKLGTESEPGGTIAIFIHTGSVHLQVAKATDTPGGNEREEKLQHVTTTTFHFKCHHVQDDESMIKSTRKRATHQSRSGDPSATQCLLCAVPTRCVFLSAGSRVTAQHWSWHMSLPSQDLSQDGMSQWRSSQIYKCHDQNIDSGYLSLWKWIDYSHPHPMGRHSIFDHGSAMATGLFGIFFWWTFQFRIKPPRFSSTAEASFNWEKSWDPAPLIGSIPAPESNDLPQWYESNQPSCHSVACWWLEKR